MRTPHVRTTSVRAGVTLLGVLALVLALSPATALAQEEEPPPDSFTCQATLVRVEDNAIIGTQTIAVANEDGGACETDDASIVGEVGPVVVGPVSVGADVLFSRTDHETDDGRGQGFAESGVLEAEIGLAGNEIEVDVLTAEAQAGPCPSTELSSDSTVVGLRVNDTEIEVPEGHTHIELLSGGEPIGTLHLNHEEFSDDGSTVTRRAFFFEDSTGVIGNVIIAEAIADVHGNPCPPERLPGWMTGGGFVAEPESKRDRNDEGSVEPGTVLHHALSLDCFVTEGEDPRPGKDNLVAQWFDEDNKEHSSFKLTELHDTRCFNTSLDPSPPRSAFDTIEGSGVGICRSQGLEIQVHVDFRFTDAGEPGTGDFAFIDTNLIGGVNTPDQLALICDYESEGFLDGGNHQAHQTPAQRAASDSNGNGGSTGNANRF